MDQQPAPSAPKPPPRRKKSSSEGSIKETIESILVAFMLAFIFRAFVVEAFVIPTGSMAPTLLGAHMRFRCPDCGYRFDVNFSTNDEMNIPASAGDRYLNIYCPNCAYRLPQNLPGDPQNDAYDPPVHYGDRILVLKYLYLLQEPQRWDVVVFKSPVTPDKYDYSQNYIKRLIGRPGERVMVLDGDVYIGTSDDLDSFKVQTKPQRAQDALWRIVYDNDYYPRGLDRSDRSPDWEPLWKPSSGGSGWDINDTKDPRRLRFNNLDGEGSIYFDSDTEAKRSALTDWLAYDVDNQSPTGEANVNDVKLDFYYERSAGEGALRTTIKRLGHTFEAEITPSAARLIMDGKSLAGPVSIKRVAGPRHIEFMAVDYRVSLRIDGTEILATTEAQYHPDLPALFRAFAGGYRQPKPEISISCEKQGATISHLSLWRDVYYINVSSQGRQKDGQYTGIPLWGSPANFPANIMKLGEDEFFVMGDNSPVSLDARFWEDPIELPHEDLKVKSGRVPRRFMLGKAFFVYWPAGYPPINGAPGIAPDFGDMRFIR